MSSTIGSARRLRRPSWKDPRLLIGILLVLASVLGVIFLVQSLDKSIEVYSARSTIAVGDRIDPESLDRVRVSLGTAEASYVLTREEIPSGSIATSPIAAGQLVPRASLGSAGELKARPVAVTVEGALPEQLVQGAHADVWVAAAQERGGFSQPELLVKGAEIARVVAGSQSFTSDSSRVVMVMIPEDSMAKILGAQNNKSRISLVWNPTGAGS